MARSEDGNATLEFSLWLPVFFSLIILAVDGTVAFMRQAHVWQVSRETARVVASHAMTPEAARIWARSHTAFGNSSPDVSVNAGSETVTVSISVPASALTLFGSLGFALGDSVATRVVHAMEPTSDT